MTIPWADQLKADKMASLHIMPFRKLNHDNWTNLLDILSTQNSSLVELNASGQIMTTDSLFMLGQTVVSKYTRGCPFQSLCFGKCSLGDDGLSAFVRGIKSSLDNATTGFLIDKLDLENKNLGSYLVEMLVDVPNVCRHLVVARNPLDVIPVSPLLQQLDLSACKLSDMSGLAGLKSLKELIIWDTEISLASFSHLVGFIRESKSLERFYYSCSDQQEIECFGNVLFKDLSSSSLIEIRLKKCKVTLDGCLNVSEFLSSTPTLEYVELSECALDSEMMKIILTNKITKSHLKHLDLSRNLICGKLLELFQSREFTRLEVLNLFGNTIVNLSLDLFFPALKRLELSCNPIESDTVFTLCSTDITKTFPSIQEIGLGGVVDLIESETIQHDLKQSLQTLQDKLTTCEITWEIGR